MRGLESPCVASTGKRQDDGKKGPKKPYVPPSVASGDMNFARAAHCGQCDEGLTGVAFTEIHPSSCDAGQEPMSNS